MPTVVHVTTVPASLAFLSGQVAFVRSQGFAVHAISSPGAALTRFAAEEGIPVHAVAMTRRITPLQDVRAIWRLVGVLRRIRPDIVHTHTPKGGLLGLLAAWLVRTPVRIYHLRGLPMTTARGPRRWLLRLSERLSCRLAHRVVAVSHSLRDLAIAERLCPAHKVKVFRGGSGNGVDASVRFRPYDARGRHEARAERALPDEALVVGYVGRLVREKGIAELAAAWGSLREELPALRLVLVGELEVEDAVPPGLVKALLEDPRVHFTGDVRDVTRCYAAMDVVALPTYREGFPNVALEAAAMALPIVATEVCGCVDAVKDGTTGTLVPAHDPGSLAAALRRYLRDPELRWRHGAAARARVLGEFRQEEIWAAVAEEYRALLYLPLKTGAAMSDGSSARAPAT